MLHAQSQTEQKLNEGIRFYQNLQTAQARGAFLAVLSPGWQFDVTRDQRVKADKYLGAVLATEGQKDSAQIYFRAALERDPFTDLDPAVFSAAERQAFAESKRNVFKIGAKPLVADTLDPKTGHLTLTVVTTHSSRLNIQIVGDSEPAFPVYDGDNDGLRTIQWSGTNLRNAIVAGGQYYIVVKGSSTLNRSVDSTTLLLDIQQLHAPLEDTLAALKQTDFLAERHPDNSARNTLLLGLGVASAAAIIGWQGSKTTSQVAVNAGPAFGVGAVAFLTGLIGFVNRQGHPEIPENVAANDQMRRTRAARNQQITASNDAKLAATKLLITPILLAGAQ